MKQYVGDDKRRLIRGQPILVTEEMVKKNLEELRAKHAQHMIEVRTRDGRLVDLQTLEAAPIGPVETKPHPLLDSVANDRNFPLPDGYRFVPERGGDDATMPQLVPAGEKPALLQGAESTEPNTAMDAVAPDVVAAADADAPEPEAAAGSDPVDAAIARAQAEATDPVAMATEDVSSDGQRKVRRNRR
jgi:hypothetical protein